ncbi:chorismate mutase [Amycolatopsis mongoliensis]|uniref:chorismate mutase n=1 Tax=Amycolatopsis mongoliensis TaxID=715475 RepID=A0A9Y2NH84_9PSEU|nr:chorismate mutase [Amycolatopsis sp. 4-36]WIY01619.1 chorismate mutase [Amycolatopsis sp. 4-36]
MHVEVITKGLPLVLAAVAFSSMAGSGVTTAAASAAEPPSRPGSAAGSGSSLPTAPGPPGPLVDLAVRRLLVSDQVATAKFGTPQPIDDPAREQQELTQVRQQAVALGIDPDATVALFQDQITASKVVQRGLFTRWTAHPGLAPTTKPDLGRIRTRLDQLTAEILNQLADTETVRRADGTCRADLAVARVTAGALDHLDGLHRHALSIALQSVCRSA